MASRPLLGSFFSCLPLCALVVATLGVARLGHQFPGAASSPGLLVPFLLPVAGLALEAGGLVALTYAQLALLLRAPRPSARARLAASLPALGLLAAVLVVAEAIPRGTEHPGAFANELLATARESCSDGELVPVPLLGLSVRCGHPQRIEGPMPGVPAVKVAMRDLTFADDLRSVQIAALELRATRAITVTLRAGSARVVGLAPWSRSPRLSALGRFGTLLALGAALCVAGALLTREPPPAGRAPTGRLRLLLVWLARGLMAAPGVAAAVVFVTLDQERAEPVAYLLAAVAGAATLALGVGLVARRVPQIFNSFRSL